MWSSRHHETRSTSLQPPRLEWSQIDRWLQAKYRSEEVPPFERTEESAKALLELIRLNEVQDEHAREALLSLQEVSASYRNEDTKLKENLHVLGIQQDHLPSNAQLLLSQLSELAMLLGTSDTTLATFHQGLAQLYLDTLQYSHQQTQQKARLAAFRRSEIEAQAGLDRLIELKRQLALQRETEGDIEQRTRRRSAELSRIRAVEDQETLQHILKTHQNSDLNIEAHGLSVAQLDSKERTVAELQAQSEAQAKMLAAYQEIPPDYTLAKLKLTEATMRLNELTAKHEALLTELANDL